MSWAVGDSTHPQAPSSGHDPSLQGSPFAADLEKYYAFVLGDDRSFGRRLRFWLSHSDFRAVACFRAYQAANRLYGRSRLLGLLPLLMATIWRRWFSVLHHVNIDRDAQIGRGFMVMHRNGLFIGPVRMGDNCVVHHNVTMGMRVAGDDGSVPAIGSNVWIGPGAIITGGVTIGDGVTISAGTVISKDVPSGCLVAGNPGRVVQKEYDNSALLNYQVPPLPQTRPEGS